MSRRAWLVLLLPLALLAGCLGDAPPTAPTKPPDVEVSQPVVDTLTDYEVFTGRTQAINAVDIRARVTGYLEQAPFQQGDDVKQGDVLFVIQQKPFEDALRQTQASLEQQRAQLKYNEANYQRLRTLASRNASAIDEMEQALATRDASQNAVKGAEAAVAIAQQNLDWSTVRAKFAGRISRRLVDPGNDVIADNTVLASLVQLDRLYAYFDVDERTLLRINHLLPHGKIPPDAAKLLPVTLGLANEKPEAFSHEGVVEFADNKVDPTTGTLRMWGTFNNPNFDLKPGLFIRVRMGLGAPRKALFVSEAALGSDQGRKFLYVVNGENKVEYRHVETGQRKNGLIAVKGLDQELTEDDRIVVNGLQRVRPPMEVEAKPVPMPPAKTQAKPALHTSQESGGNGKSSETPSPRAAPHG
jgi:RND family efflux transporter MFP subunit